MKLNKLIDKDVVIYIIKKDVKGDDIEEWLWSLERCGYVRENKRRRKGFVLEVIESQYDKDNSIVMQFARDGLL